MMSKIATNFEEEESKTQNFRAARALSDISVVHPVNLFLKAKNYTMAEEIFCKKNRVLEGEAVFFRDKNRREAANFFLGQKSPRSGDFFFEPIFKSKKKHWIGMFLDYYNHN